MSNHRVAPEQRSDTPLLVETILGHRDQEPWRERLHEVSHHGALEILQVAPADITRRRFRGVTDAGTDCAVSLPRSMPLFDGAVLYLQGDRAIVLRLGEQQWVRLRATNAADALELGYHAGNLHWRVRFVDADLEVAVDGDVGTYLERIAPMINDRRVLRVS